MIPLPYERNQYSQNGEDGIIHAMTSRIIDPNKIFLEIGWGDGSCNMTRALAESGWTGVGVDAMYQPDPTVTYPKDFIFKSMMVNPDNFAEAFADTPPNVDFFSLDIDSFDYDVCAWLLVHGRRPKTVCVEINPRFGAKAMASFPYKPRTKKKLYKKTSIYGSSIAKYKSLWEHHGYRYFGYDSTLTNAFFYDPDQVAPIDLPVHTLEEFPVKEDTMLERIQEHPYWKSLINEIYKS